MNPLTGIMILLGLITLMSGKDDKGYGEGESPTGNPPKPGSGLPRGIRNHNPGNIKISNTPWKGKIPVEQNTDKVFEQFKDKPWGTRAMIKTLQTYQSRYGLNTIRKIMHRYAPNSENATSNYIGFLEREIGVPADTLINTKDAGQMRPLIKSMVEFENGVGKNWLTDSDFNRGWAIV